LIYYAHLELQSEVINDEILLTQRKLELTERQQMYKWKIYFKLGVPSGIASPLKNIPTDEQFRKVKSLDFGKAKIKAFLAIGAKSLVLSDELYNYAYLAKQLNPGDSIPLYQVGRWTSDAEFGRQMLNGVNPMVIEKCSKLPPNFPVTNELVKPYLVRGLSLEEEMKVSKRYFSI